LRRKFSQRYVYTQTQIWFDRTAAFDSPRSSFGERVAHGLVTRLAQLGINDPRPILPILHSCALDTMAYAKLEGSLGRSIHALVDR
jgi:hypothetical protein